MSSEHILAILGSLVPILGLVTLVLKKLNTILKALVPWREAQES